MTPTASRAGSGAGAGDEVTAAIERAWDAARAAGLSPTNPDEHEPDPGRKISYAFELGGLGSAPDVGALEKALEALDGVRARIVYPSATAYVTAPETVPLAELAAVMDAHGVTAVLTDSSLRRRLFSPRRLEHGTSTTMPGRTRRHLVEESKSLQRARAAGFLADSHRHGHRHQLQHQKNHPKQRPRNDERNVLFTARELISPWRLMLALVFTLPVVVLSYVQDLQFEGWQWVALALATPVVGWCAWPFHRALAGGVRRGITALDGASSVAVLAAYLWSLFVLVFTPAGSRGWTSTPSWFAFEHGSLEGGELFLDVACVMTTVLLAGRLGTMRSRASLLDEMDARRPDPHTPVLVEKPRRAGTGTGTGIGAGTRPEAFKVPLNEVNIGDDVVVGAGHIIPVDGSVIGGSCRISPSLVSAGAKEGDEVKVGDYVFAGTKNRDGRLKVRVERTGHQTRMAAVHRWVEEANTRQNRATMLSTKTASFLIPAAITIAVLDFALWWLITGNLSAAFATSLAVLASVAPVALALSTSLAVRHGIEAAARSGVMVRDGATLRELQGVDTVVFNRLGTLTTNEMKLESVIAERGENPELVLRVAAALVMESDHPTSRAIVKAARASRDHDEETNSLLPHWIEVSQAEYTELGTFTGHIQLPSAGPGGEVTHKQVLAELWRPRTMSDLPGRLAAAVVAGGTPFVVRWQGMDRGAVTLMDFARPDAQEGVELLRELGVESLMLSRDAYPVARRFADRLGIDSVLAGIAPGDKPKAVRSVHTQGATTAMVGDHSVLETMKSADVGILIGETESLDLNSESAHDGVQVVVLPDEVTTIARLLAHSRRVCRIIDRNTLFSWGYNVVAVVLSVAGVLNPMLATLMMVGSSVIVEKRSSSARTFHRLG